jgi:hypothetical protein
VTASNLRNRKPTIREAPDLMKVIEAMRTLRCDARPSEVANYSGLSQRRTDAALREAESKGLIHVGFWRLTKKEKRS